jgi:hypothetical protein
VQSGLPRRKSRLEASENLERRAWTPLLAGQLHYGYAILGRQGLGNMLFPFARCFLWCRDQQLPMIAPKWTQFRLGPYIRRERDKRQYQRLFRHDGYVTGLRRLSLLLLLPKISEGGEDLLPEDAGASRTIVVFRGMEGMFEPLLGRNAEVRSEIERITRAQYLSSQEGFAPFIGVHVRRGDFRESTDPAVLHQGVKNVRIPLEWYVVVLQHLRRALGFEARARVFSDGAEKELFDLLALPGVTFSSGGQAITDMLEMTRASAMIASGSTFSMWASFLGRVPSVWYPGQRRQFLMSQDHEGTLEPEVLSWQDFPPEFLSTVRNRWRNIA